MGKRILLIILFFSSFILKNNAQKYIENGKSEFYYLDNIRNKIMESEYYKKRNLKYSYNETLQILNLKSKNHSVYFTLTDYNAYLDFDYMNNYEEYLNYLEVYTNYKIKVKNEKDTLNTLRAVHSFSSSYYGTLYFNERENTITLSTGVHGNFYKYNPKKYILIYERFISTCLQIEEILIKYNVKVENNY